MVIDDNILCKIFLSDGSIKVVSLKENHLPGQYVDDKLIIMSYLVNKNNINVSLKRIKVV